MKLLSIGNDSKTVKGEKFGYRTAILYMAPSNASDVTNTCRYASKGCRAACLYTAGRGVMSNVQQARIRKTKYWFQSPTKFIDQLNDEIRKESTKATKQGYKFAVRLNGTSDIPWESQTVIQSNPDIQFYDYTKNWRRIYAYLDGRNRLSNYDLTFSRSESNDEHCDTILRRGGRVAMVFSDLSTVLPSDQKPSDHTFQYRGEYWPIWDGDLSDVRFDDPSNGIVALQAKGKGKQDVSGFVL
jgi:hypothetical protein